VGDESIELLLEPGIEAESLDVPALDEVGEVGEAGEAVEVEEVAGGDEW
jgi:hypothetical protein